MPGYGRARALACALTLAALAAMQPVVSGTLPEAGASPSADAAAQLLHERFAHMAERQCFPWTLHQSVARDDFEYPDLDNGGVRRTAKKGELVQLRCDSVICPNPAVPDCYMADGVCGADEWCNLEDQVRFGPWAMAGAGETPNVGYLSCRYYKENGYDFIFDKVCQNESNWGPWKPVRGRCASYRQEQQSCNAYFVTALPSRDGGEGPDEGAGRAVQRGGSGALRRARLGAPAGAAGRPDDEPEVARRRLLMLDSFHAPGGSAEDSTLLGDLYPQYVVDEQQGRPPRRPQLCAPGLACTGDFDPVPNTCVKLRPPNVCYQGPWWDSSTWCKVGGASNSRLFGGLPLSDLHAAAQALLVQLPTEVFGNPLTVNFWASSAADEARRKAQVLLRTLWPDVYRARTKFPLSFPDPRVAGVPGSVEYNTTAHQAAELYRQSNRVWSTVHTLIHNARDPMPGKQIRASRALAVWLRQHFMCCNCRGMWANYVLNGIGLPPTSSSREEHKRWWWRAHNMVSEHAASTRGGHPWIYPGMTDAQFEDSYAEYGGKLQCQNPWFLPYEFADVMWKIDDVTAAMD